MKDTALSFRRLPCQGKNQTFLLTGIVLSVIVEESNKGFLKKVLRFFKNCRKTFSETNKEIFSIAGLQSALLGMTFNF